MNRWAIVIFAVLIAPLWGCDKTESSDKPAAEDVSGWTGQIAFLEATGDPKVEVQRPGSDAFETFAGGESISAGSVVRTGPNTRARLVVDGATIVVDHSSELTLSADAERTVELRSGRLVLQTEGEGKGESTIVLPTGKVVLHGTKVSAVAGEEVSTISVASGTVEVVGATASIEARAGDELVLPRDANPTVHSTPELGAEFGWSELVDPEGASQIEVPRGLGKLVGKAPGGERERALELVEHSVETNIQGNVAYTEVTERFRNPTGEVLEGVYRFPLPADAQISRLALEVDGKLMEGEFLETERAEWIWRDIISQSRDPAMLKWKEGNQFELRIFPINPRSVRRVIIGYTQRLQPSVGGYRYVYPMPVDHAGDIPAESFKFAANVEGHDPTGLFQVTGYDAKVAHKGKPDDSARTEVRWDKDDFIASGDLSIRYSVPFDADGFEAFRFDSTKREDAGFFSVAVRPDLPRADEISSRDVVIAIDRSYHRKGGALKLQKEVTARMLRELDPLDRVAVIACNTECEPVGPAGFGRVLPARLDETTSALEALTAQGANNPIEVARVAAGIFGSRTETAASPRVIWFSDGVASAGELRPGKLRDALERVGASQPMRVTLVGVGAETDDANLDAIVQGLDAVRVELDPAMSMTGHALALLSTLYGELLTDVTVELPQGAQAVYPREFGPIAPGGEIAITGRVEGVLSGDVVVRGRLNGDDWSASYPVKLTQDSTANSFLPRIWASARIRDLELAEDDNKSTIVELSKRYGVLSRYTTLLALENDEMMEEYGVQKRRYDEWDGSKSLEDSDARAEMEPSEESEEPPAMPARPKAKPSASRSKSAPMKKGPPQESTMDVFGGGSAPNSGSGLGAVRRSRRMTHYRRPARHHVTLEVAKTEATDWERTNVERWEKRLASEPGNRTRTMRLIRAMLRANQMDEAKARIDAWIATNDRDPEALVQLGQWHSLRGELDHALVQLTNGVDVAPRGEWIQERVHRAYAALGDEALSCAHGVALRAIQKRPEYDQDDVLSCPLATDLSQWDSGAVEVSDTTDAAARKAEIEAEMRRLAGAPDGSGKPPNNARLHGDLQVRAKWEGPADIDLIVLEPDGRPLSYLSQRRRIDVGEVRAGNSDHFALPSMRAGGTYEILVVRSASEGTVSGELEVKVKGKTKTFPFRLSAGETSVRVAEAEWQWRW